MDATLTFRAAGRLARLAPILVAALFLFPLPAGAMTHIPAHAPVRPELFRLSPGAFSTGSQLIRANVESNTLLLQDQPTHFGLPPGAIGRLTGYFMEAEDVVQAPANRAYTSYLVSIFRSSALAQLAFDARWQMWYRASFYSFPPAIHLGFGTHGQEALFHSFAPNPYLAELFFRRGSIVGEVFQGVDRGGPTQSQSESMYAIAAALSDIARRHPRGA